jgi:hypothetical protein
MPAQRLFWDAAATLGIADGKVLSDFYFRPMTRPNEMLATWSEAGLRSVEQSSITIRFEYENFSDYWLPIAAGESPHSASSRSALRPNKGLRWKRRFETSTLAASPMAPDPSPRPPPQILRHDRLGMQRYRLSGRHAWGG